MARTTEPPLDPIQPAHSQNGPDGAIVAQIAREIVHIHASFYGRGPTKAKAIWRGDCVVVILEEIFTKAEEILTDAGRFEHVRQHRQAFQDQVEPVFCQAVEVATGRKVRAFLSQVTEEGIASEVFVLEPSNGGNR
jgi:uncharacterized protein YbcI